MDRRRGKGRRSETSDRDGARRRMEWVHESPPTTSVFSPNDRQVGEGRPRRLYLRSTLSELTAEMKNERVEKPTDVVSEGHWRQFAADR